MENTRQSENETNPHPCQNSTSHIQPTHNLTNNSDVCLPLQLTRFTAWTSVYPLVKLRHTKDEKDI